MKVEVFSESSLLILQDLINEFIKDKRVFDIKFQSVFVSAESVTDNVVMVMYEETPFKPDLELKTYKVDGVSKVEFPDTL